MNRWVLPTALLCIGWLGTISCSHGSPTDLGDLNNCCTFNPQPKHSADIDLDSTGAVPSLVSVFPGSPVRFHNRDTVSRQIGPADFSPCPELSGPVIAPGSTFTAVMANKVESCAFLDTQNPNDSRFRGTVDVRN